MTPTEQLCLACGLCCDGTLFDGVQLEPGDDAARLRARGLPVAFSRGRKPVGRFPQPCAALCADRTCRLYRERPGQCRSFECKLYKQTRAGEVELAPALRLVAKTRRLADRARRLLQRLGDAEQQRSLGERFHRMDDRLRADPSDAEALALFADLSYVIHQLKLLAHERFYTRAEKTSLAE
ncbi:MAG: YkgJ family cysteine cluster protein [Candidatus Didemnitutus sp.]|nr:YkgJ family cysteine cluster protein [Candidatus Didemnitutus sp.]